MADGKEITGRGYDEIVQRMSDEKLTEPRSLESYRRATANRVSAAFGVLIDASTSRSLLLSLESVKLVERVS